MSLKLDTLYGGMNVGNNTVRHLNTILEENLNI